MDELDSFSLPIALPHSRRSLLMIRHGRLHPWLAPRVIDQTTVRAETNSGSQIHKENLPWDGDRLN